MEVKIYTVRKTKTGNMDWRKQALSMQAQALSSMQAVRWRRKDQGVGQAFKNDRQIQQFVLSDVTPTGRILGTGLYGSMEEVSHLASFN